MTSISQGEFFVLVFKDGLLSRLGHDVRLQLDRFEIEVDEDRVSGRFQASSLRVDTAMRDGVPRPGDLSPKDSREIESTVADRILKVAAYPEVRFEGSISQRTEDSVAVGGTLTMLGKSQPLDLLVRRRSGVLEGETSLVPSRWGIKPFKALMGALRIQDRADIRFSLTDPAA